LDQINATLTSFNIFFPALVSMLYGWGQIQKQVKKRHYLCTC